jgi:hypothetical protein
VCVCVLLQQPGDPELLKIKEDLEQVHQNGVEMVFK